MLKLTMNGQFYDLTMKIHSVQNKVKIKSPLAIKSSNFVINLFSRKGYATLFDLTQLSKIKS